MRLNGGFVWRSEGGRDWPDTGCEATLELVCEKWIAICESRLGKLTSPCFGFVWGLCSKPSLLEGSSGLHDRFFRSLSIRDRSRGRCCCNPLDIASRSIE